MAAMILGFLLAPVPGRAGDAFGRITPAEAGYSEEGLRALEQVLAESGSESMLLLHDGKVFFEWGDIRKKRLVHSIRKPLLHALIGVEIAKGNDCLDLDRTVRLRQGAAGGNGGQRRDHGRRRPRPGPGLPDFLRASAQSACPQRLQVTR
jgi:hypothetical protein